MPSEYDVNKIARVGHLKSALVATKAKLDETIKYVSVANNTISFFKTADGSGTAAYTVNFPSELVLDAVKTTFAPSFTWSSTTYPGSTNPNLDGKPVLIIAIKETNAAGTVTTTYSFVDMTSLVDVYTAGDNSIDVTNNAIRVKISAVLNNALELKSDGLFVDISGKADKVANATAGDIATLDANGNLVDSGTTFATDTEITALIAEVYGA